MYVWGPYVMSCVPYMYRVYTCTCVYTYIHVHACTCVHIHTCTCMCYTCTINRTGVHVLVQVPVHMYMYSCTQDITCSTGIHVVYIYYRIHVLVCAHTVNHTHTVLYRTGNTPG